MSDKNNNTGLFLPSEEADPHAVPFVSKLLDLSGFPNPKTVDSDVNAYCFSLATGKVVFGMRIRELPDSFLVALPCVLFGEDGTITGRSLVSEPVVRIFKSSLLYACRAPEGQRYFYYKYLLGKRDVLPEVLSKERIELMTTETVTAPESSLAAIEAVSNMTRSDSDDSDDLGRPSFTLAPYNKKTKH